ncbi:MAG: alpha/beta hydrolase [Alphaproteobacteria bacterium]|nr:alpha/beta hydrolase [Alphaproteobacteria bacterium]
MSYREATYRAGDGLALYFRDYAAAHDALTPVLCLPGLTRNSKDFEGIAAHLAKTRRVIAPDLRGRGRSAYDPNYKNYAIPVEIADVFALMAAERLERVIIIGTSRGGLIASGMAVMRPAAVAGIVLNDIGPELAPEGIARILGYAGRIAEPESWEDAVRLVKSLNAPMFALDEAGWMRFARSTFRDERGRPRLDYDTRIGDAIREAAAAGEAGGADPWAVFKAMAPTPTLVVRGENSDLLSPGILARMHEARPDLKSVEVKARGHAPFLDEEEAIDAIDAFLGGIDRA